MNVYVISRSQSEVNCKFLYVRSIRVIGAISGVILMEKGSRACSAEWENTSRAGQNNTLGVMLNQQHQCREQSHR